MTGTASGDGWLARIASLAPLGLLLAATAFSAWLLQDNALGALHEDPVADHTPNLIVEGLEAVAMDENGQPRRRVRAAEMAHFPDTETHELKEPWMQVFTPGADPWFVTSQRGWLSADGEVMRLIGDVHIWRNGEDGKRRLDIRTSDLRVLPESEYGETDQPVTITTPHGQSSSVGARAFLADGRVEMLSKVKTIYKRDGFKIQ